MPHPHPTQQQGITDLTVLAEIKPGLVEGILESRSYVWRLQSVLRLLDDARRERAERDLLPSPFVDAVERLRGIHFFRFAVLPQQGRLLLNVTFDGGWEPYMRQIWGPLGTLLDLIFCHCTTYPLAAASSYDSYIRWVRENEVPSHFFFVDSGATVADRAYLTQLEARQRVSGHQADADSMAARLAIRPHREPEPDAGAALAALRTLKGLYGLISFFGRPSASSGRAPALDDGSVLQRFAQDYLSALFEWIRRGLFKPGQSLAPLSGPFAEELDWLGGRPWSRPSKKDALKFDRSVIQAGILRSPKAPAGRYARGALVLARVGDADAGCQWLQSMAADGRIASDTTEALSDHGVTCTVALTCRGLQALGMPESRLSELPAEFVQGMEMRAGILGDVRGNHPSRWRRPRSWRSGGRALPVDLRMVHLVLQLRTVETDSERATDRAALLPRLAQWIDDASSSSAIEVLAVEPGWSRPPAEGEPAARDHFGFVDGVSQPALTSHGKAWDDKVANGELLIGWANDRGDGPLEVPDGKPTLPCWLDFGTFMVVRKIRQHVGTFDTIVAEAAEKFHAAGGAASLELAREEVRSRLLGRRSDGRPMVELETGSGINDFNYRDDEQGARCPFASHVRRANPREIAVTGRPPRIMRRGMSYGPPVDPDRPDPGAERGLLFIAYNASIAEQFEVIQRWLTGGNSSGVSSSRTDPFVGVPRSGEPRIFGFANGEKNVTRVDLGDQPISSLDWGLYAFVPSIALLRDLSPLLAEQDRPQHRPGRPDEMPGEAARRRVKLEFEDDLNRQSRWQRVRAERSGVEKIGDSVMVGAYEPLLRVLRDPGSTYSVVGYGERMRATLGGSPFGQDNVGPCQGHQRAFVGAVKRAVAGARSEPQAYDDAYRFVAGLLAAALAEAQALHSRLPSQPPVAAVDMVGVGIQLVGELCRQWFGVVYSPDQFQLGGPTPHATPARCPGHLMTMSRLVFSADPNPTVKGLSAAQAAPLQTALAAWAADPAAAASAPVSRAVLDAIDRSPDKVAPEERVGTLANVLFGLPATLLGSWVKVLLAWSAGGELWALQHALPVGTRAEYSDAEPRLRSALLATMAADPVADGIWRTAAQAHVFRGVQVEPGDLVRLGIGSALAGARFDPQMAEDLLFGGAWEPGSARDAVHACPGRRLAIGALLGALAAWLQAGQWSTTASRTTLALEALS